MSPPRSLPRHRSDAWLGGFAIDAPVYTSSISASGGSVVAATERLYRLRPGTTRFGWWDPPREWHGDITCVAVEPRRPGQPARFAYAACPNTLYLVDDEKVVPIELPLADGRDPRRCVSRSGMITRVLGLRRPSFRRGVRRHQV